MGDFYLRDGPADCGKDQGRRQVQPIRLLLRLGLRQDRRGKVFARGQSFEQARKLVFDQDRQLRIVARLVDLHDAVGVEHDQRRRQANVEAVASEGA